MKIKAKLISALLIASLGASACACSNNSVAGTDVSDETIPSSSSEAVESAQPTTGLEDKTFENMYGSQLITYLNHQYQFQGENVPLAESNFYFINDFLDLTQYAQYGYYPATSEGYLDLTYPLEEGSYDESVAGHCDTWGDFFLSFAQKDLEGVCIMNTIAQEQNLELSAETLESIDSLITNLTSSAEAVGMSLDDYLALYYGPDCNEEMFRYILNRYYIADLVTSNYVENYEFTDEELAEISVPLVRYALFSAPESTASDEEKAAAETAANELLGRCETVDDLTTYGTELQDSGEVLQYGEVSVVRNQFVSAFEDWSWDEARTDGEMGVIYAPEYGYFVVGYVNKSASEDDKNQIAYNAFSEELAATINSGDYSFSTDDEFAPVPTVAPAETTTTDATAVTGDAVTETSVATANQGEGAPVKRILIAGCAIAGVAILAFGGMLIFDKKKGGK